MIQVHKFSDFVCPWCWIGKRNLDAFARERPLSRTYWPYYLHPDLPVDGVDRTEMILAKFGSLERARELGRMVEDAALASGLALDLGTVKHVPNTRNAHRLMRWAAGQDMADDVAERLFAAHFAEGRNIGDVATLVEIGAAAGLDASLIADLLAGDADREIVDNQASQAREMGISGVPTMVFDRKVTVVGAQPVDALRAAAARADLREPRATSF